ncbi:hypothetical protein PF003_g36115 [Phytophthora fragariae]|nr:hypothetical protein PF003_g36115 [Phytophthora fragariae]
MKFTLPEDTFPAVTLSKEKQAALIEEAETVVRQSIAANEEFLAGGATFHDSRGSTRKDPFQSLTIKWFVKEIPAMLSGIIMRRDYLVLEGTGLARDSRGDTVGYYLLHSVSVPAIPELSEFGIVRGQLSFCYIDRQSGPGRVELYCRGFSDPCGGLIDRLSVAIMADSLLSAAGIIDFAYIKKLTWLMKNKAVSQQNG